MRFGAMGNQDGPLAELPLPAATFQTGSASTLEPWLDRTYPRKECDTVLPFGARLILLSFYNLGGKHAVPPITHGGNSHHGPAGATRCKDDSFPWHHRSVNFTSTCILIETATPSR